MAGSRACRQWRYESHLDPKWIYSRTQTCQMSSCSLVILLFPASLIPYLVTPLPHRSTTLLFLFVVAPSPHCSTASSFPCLVPLSPHCSTVSWFDMEIFRYSQIQHLLTTVLLRALQLLHWIWQATSSARSFGRRAFPPRYTISLLLQLFGYASVVDLMVPREEFFCLNLCFRISGTGLILRVITALQPVSC